MTNKQKDFVTMDNKNAAPERIGWKCNCCCQVFTHEQQERNPDNNGGAPCPSCKAHGQYTYLFNLHEGDPSCVLGPERIAPERIEINGGYYFTKDGEDYFICDPQGKYSNGYSAAYTLEDAQSFATAMQPVPSESDEAVECLRLIADGEGDAQVMAQQTLDSLARHRQPTPASAVQPAVGDDNMDVFYAVEASRILQDHLSAKGIEGGHDIGILLIPLFRKALAAHTQHTTALEAEEKLDRVVQAAFAAIDHVGAANYAHRQKEARDMVRQALQEEREVSAKLAEALEYVRNTAEHATALDAIDNSLAAYAKHKEGGE